MVLGEFKVAHTVTDNASNIVAEFSLPGFSEVDTEQDTNLVETDQEISEDIVLSSEHDLSFVHTIQLVMKGGEKNASQLYQVPPKFLKPGIIGVPILCSNIDPRV